MSQFPSFGVRSGAPALRKTGRNAQPPQPQINLALFLDGSIGESVDALVPGGFEMPGGSHAINTFLNEPLSGAYNTIEFAAPNTVGLQTSQDVGVNQVAYSTTTKYNQNCNGAGAPEWNAQGVHMGTIQPNGATRTRATGAAEELSELFATNDGIGYAFWSVPNFANASASTSKYLTIGGIDPIETTYTR